VAHATNSQAVAQGFPESSPQHDSYVLNQVVPTGMDVALCFKRYVNQAVASNLADHVVQEAVAGDHIIPALAVQVNKYVDAGLPGLALQ
jgi:hypothetical protein